MHILYFQEDSKITPSKIKSEFESTSAYPANNLIKKLKSTKVLYQKSSKVEINSLVNADLENEIKYDEYFYFKYVGILLIKDICIVVYPKYINNIFADYSGNKQKLIQILRVIQKFQSLYIDSNLEFDNDNESFLALKMYLQTSYFENGLYSSETTNIELNGDGEILWDKTINEKNAHIIKGVPFYLNYINKNVIQDNGNIIRRIHAAILTEISTELKDVLNLIGFEPVIISDDYLEDIGNSDYLEYLLESELNSQFINSKQLILKNLLKYIRKKALKTDSSEVEFYGTSSFNLVWEEVCKKYYKNDLNKTLAELNLISEGTVIKKNNYKLIQYRQDLPLKEVVDVPKWTLMETETEYKASKTLELDILHVNNIEKRFDIFDAKYYLIEFTDSRVRKQPGVGDITKQYLYELAFSNLAMINQYTFTNSFIVPKDNLAEDNDLGVKYSYVSLEFMDDLGLDPINVIARDPQIMYSKYLT
ncbi:Type-2 restriction enzyme BsuMI component YdjA [Jeotgalibaca dankookensis]|uniref:Type-2 restriction enzyme BsuMI component YdjA n=1 Tax=Jeotgalibaca dankookensis TaxID=708126 RepID=A0A1S6IQC8_9LACT|nr:LlaJI family restriction endonuclease [Jeotgalibaca dankookensis]AQS53729.1 Type-2 restriction enzyme BsuMI component YdjA [Jeotgalibaca dankookensis]